MSAHRCFSVIIPIITFAGLLIFPSAGSSDDWPQWRGVNRTAKSAETGLLNVWPEGGPSLVWKAEALGGGYSTPSIANGRIFAMGYRGDDEVIWALNEADGKELWSTRIAEANHNVGYDDGPRCTPTVDGEFLYAVGVSGDLVCLECSTGKEVWRRNFVEDLAGSIPNWGYSESPLLEGDMIIAVPGGSKATVAAFDKKTGATIWAASPQGRSEGAGYASPISFTVGDLRQIAVFTQKGGIGLRADNGEFLWRNDKAANPTANCATPIFSDNRILFTSDYGTGCVVLDLHPDGTAHELYFNRNMKNHHGGIIHLDGFIYGFNGSVLTCIDFATGEPSWRNRSVGKGSVCYADGKLYALSERGRMGLIEATPAGYREISRFDIPHRSNRPSWSHPIIANGKLYVRDQGMLLCYDISE